MGDLPAYAVRSQTLLARPGPTTARIQQPRLRSNRIGIQLDTEQQNIQDNLRHAEKRYNKHQVKRTVRRRTSGIEIDDEASAVSQILLRLASDSSLALPHKATNLEKGV